MAQGNEININEIIKRIKHKNFKLQDVYALPLLVSDINKIYIDSELLLIYALYHLCDKPKLFHALLQCGCDMFTLNNEGISAYYLTHIDDTNDIPDDIKEIFKLYYPGIWAAVDHCSIELLRKSLNLWCRPDIQRDGIHLLQLAEQKKNKQIISLLESISKSILLAHAVLANRTKEATVLLKSAMQNVPVQDGGINVNIQNLGALGATPLYFAMQNNNEQLVSLLLEHGANPSKVLTLENEVEIPVVFLCLRSNISFDIYRIIIDKAVEILDLASLRYKSCTILHCAVDNDVTLEKIEYLLQVADSRLIAARSNRNLCAIDVVVNPLIKEKIQKKITDNINNFNFTLDLVVYGYQDFIDSLTDSELFTNKLQFEILNNLQHQIRQFSKFLSESNLVGIQKYLVFQYTHPPTSNDLMSHPEQVSTEVSRLLLTNCFGAGDGQPFLHKAVFRGDCKVVQLLCSVIVGSGGRKIDTIIDQYGRNALSYAYLMTENPEIANILIQFGSSDYAIDYDLKSPLSFKDKRTHLKKDDFLGFHLKQMYDEEEPLLWDSVYPSNTRNFMLSSCNSSGGTSADITGRGRSHNSDNCEECWRTKNAARIPNSPVAAGNEDLLNEDADAEVDDDDDDDDDDDEPAGVCRLS